MKVDGFSHPPSSRKEMLAWTWNYVKDANRAASDALQQDIDGPDFAWWPEPTRWQRLKAWALNRCGF